MFNCIGLSKKNIDIMKEFNNKRIEFNQLNDDFFDEYNSCNYAQQIFLIKKVKLLLYDSNYIGYLWLGSKNRNNTVIKSINVDTGFDLPTTFKILINSVNNKTDFTYMCLDNGTNFYILEKVGFVKDKGTLEMAKDITDIKELFYDENIDFQVFKRGVHEKLRCELQNEIFKNSSRVPLSIEDIYYDELQSYYYSQGSIFIKYKHKYIGYGQIIIENNSATIVNFGILPKYRNSGYGQMLLIYLLNIIRQNNYDYAYIRVDSENYNAIRLYESCGFQINNIIYKWILKRT